MLRVTYIIVAMCLIIWAIGFFLYRAGMVIHLLLVIAVIIASIKVLEK